MRLAVIGAGTMGSQIAQQAALHGVTVSLVDQDRGQLQRAASSNMAQIERRVAKKKLSNLDAEMALLGVSYTEELSAAVAQADLIIEAITENLPAKKRLFRELEELAPRDAILATNSSSILTSEITDSLQSRDRTAAMHFFNPALVMRLVEIAPAPYTSKGTLERMVEFCTAIDREPVVLQKEVNGLLANRVLAAIRREAFWLADNGYADPKDIDRAVKLGLNHPMGPFELADFAGLDIVLAANEHRYSVSRSEADRPPKVLKRLVAEGKLGRKTGQGFYSYDDPEE